MKKEYKAVIRAFFSDYACWLFGVTALLAAAFAIGMRGGIGGGVWVIPILLLLLYALSAPLFVLYCKAKRDMKNGQVEKVLVQAAVLLEDARLNFRNRGGAIVGKKKYRIIDENGNVYLLSASDNRDALAVWQPACDFPLEIEVLKQARLVLHMRVAEPAAGAHAERRDRSAFRQKFSLYFS